MQYLLIQMPVQSVVLTQKGDIKQVRIQVPEVGLTLEDISAKVFKRKEIATLLGTIPQRMKVFCILLGIRRDVRVKRISMNSRHPWMKNSSLVIF
jgi:hypothetical protein